MKLKTAILMGAMLFALTGALEAQQRSILPRTEANEAALKPKADAAAAALAAAEAAAAETDPPGVVSPPIRTAAAAAAAALASADPWTARLGDGWREKWRTSTLPAPDVMLVDAFLENEWEVTVDQYHTLKILPVADRIRLQKHVAAKPTLSRSDFELVKSMEVYEADLVPRLPELAKFLASGGKIRGEEFYNFRNITILRRNPRDGKWQTAIRADEWLDLAMANAHFSTETFTVGRDQVTLRAARLLIDKRKAEGLSVEGAEFDTAFAPVLAALKAPKFGGLRDACLAIGINMGLPEQIDWSVQEAVAANVASAAERNGNFITAWSTQVPYEQGLGSVMFVKGEADYATWREATLAND